MHYRAVRNLGFKSCETALFWFCTGSFSQARIDKLFLLKNTVSSFKSSTSKFRTALCVNMERPPRVKFAIYTSDFCDMIFTLSLNIEAFIRLSPKYFYGLFCLILSIHARYCKGILQCGATHDIHLYRYFRVEVFIGPKVSSNVPISFLVPGRI